MFYYEWVDGLTSSEIVNYLLLCTVPYGMFVYHKFKEGFHKLPSPTDAYVFCQGTFVVFAALGLFIIPSVLFFGLPFMITFTLSMGLYKVGELLTGKFEIRRKI